MTSKDQTSDAALSEREKWQMECAFRERELQRAEAEIKIKADELELRRNEQQQSRWRNPVLIAVGAAIVAAFGNGIVAWTNGASQRDLEERKAEQTRILEMIKTGDQKAAVSNLRFLVEAGLVSDDRRRAQLERYLNKHRDAGPVLPAANAAIPQRPMDALRIEIFHCASLGEEAQRQANDALGLESSLGGDWSATSLSRQVNEQVAYRVRRNEIRFNQDEQAAATAIQQALLGIGLQFELVPTGNYTRQYLSVFLCEGAPEIPPDETPTDFGNTAD